MYDMDGNEMVAENFTGLHNVGLVILEFPGREQSVHQPAMHERKRPDRRQSGLHRLPVVYAGQRNAGCAEGHGGARPFRPGRLSASGSSETGRSGSMPSTVPGRWNWRYLAPSDGRVNQLQAVQRRRRGVDYGRGRAGAADSAFTMYSDHGPDERCVPGAGLHRDSDWRDGWQLGIVGLTGARGDAGNADVRRHCAAGVVVRWRLCHGEHRRSRTTTPSRRAEGNAVHECVDFSNVRTQPAGNRSSRAYTTNAAGEYMTAALFRDATANSLCCSVSSQNSADPQMQNLFTPTLRRRHPRRHSRCAQARPAG